MSEFEQGSIVEIMVALGALIKKSGGKLAIPVAEFVEFQKRLEDHEVIGVSTKRDGDKWVFEVVENDKKGFARMLAELDDAVLTPEITAEDIELMRKMGLKP